jgi:hypothetical protein
MFKSLPAKIKFSIVIVPSVLTLIVLSCSSRNGRTSEEQLRVQSASSNVSTDTSQFNSIKGNLSLNQIGTYPNRVVLTGLPLHRLVTVYKSIKPAKNKERAYSYDYYDYEQSEYEQFFMPGIDLIHGYNLLNIAHYDMASEQMAFLFEQPVLVKSLYYPSFEQDSLNEKPINRDYYLVSVYDEDTNKDSLINKLDLRRFYHFNASSEKKTQLIPADYSVERSQYDSKNDVMYVFARQDVNKDGIVNKEEPLHVFWFSLMHPTVATSMY